MYMFCCVSRVSGNAVVSPWSTLNLQCTHISMFNIIHSLLPSCVVGMEVHSNSLVCGSICLLLGSSIYGWKPFYRKLRPRFDGPACDGTFHLIWTGPKGNFKNLQWLIPSVKGVPKRFLKNKSTNRTQAHRAPMVMDFVFFVIDFYCWQGWWFQEHRKSLHM